MLHLSNITSGPFKRSQEQSWRWEDFPVSHGSLEVWSEDLFKGPNLSIVLGANKQIVVVVAFQACHMKHLWNSKSQQLFPFQRKEGIEDCVCFCQSEQWKDSNEY